MRLKYKIYHKIGNIFTKSSSFIDIGHDKVSGDIFPASVRVLWISQCTSVSSHYTTWARAVWWRSTVKVNDIIHCNIMWLKMRNFCNVCMIASDFWCIFKNIFSGVWLRDEFCCFVWSNCHYLSICCYCGNLHLEFWNVSDIDLFPFQCAPVQVVFVSSGL